MYWLLLCELFYFLISRAYITFATAIHNICGLLPLSLVRNVILEDVGSGFPTPGIDITHCPSFVKEFLYVSQINLFFRFATLLLQN